MSFKPIDSKRDQFRKYIESSGVVEMLSKVLIQLLQAQDKPENPIEFIRDNLGASVQEKLEIDFLKQEIENYKQEVELLKKQLNDLKPTCEGGELPVKVDDIKIEKTEDDESDAGETIVADATEITVAAEIAEAPKPIDPEVADEPTVAEAKPIVTTSISPEEIAPEATDKTEVVASSEPVANATAAPAV